LIKYFIKLIKKHAIDIGLTFGSIILVVILHWSGVFDFLELKTYDYRFHAIRGPLTGWRASDSTIIENGTDIVLVEVDDEAWRLIPSKWPYPRGDVWAKAIENLSNAGAKVIAFDVQFDSPDTRSEYLRDYQLLLNDSKSKIPIPTHGDEILAASIRKAQGNGTEIVINVKMVREPTRIPPQYIAYPVEKIMEANPETGLINDMMDIDGFSREYSIAGYMDHERDQAYLTLALKCVKAFVGLPDTTLPKFNYENLSWSYGPYQIKANGPTNNFLVNYYGPPSGYKMPGDKNLPPWSTYPRYSMAQIMDTKDYELKYAEEDLDWMDQFLPGEMPEWIKSIEDPIERNEMAITFGFGESYDVTKSPFYNKIVILGVAVEVLHDVKSTPFYNYMNLSQLTPGMETHANAIQTILHNNHISIFGGKLTRLYKTGISYPLENFLLITFLSVMAFILLTKLQVHPVLAGILTLGECIVYYGVAIGLFINDVWWLPKTVAQWFVPPSVDASLISALPSMGESYVMPIVAPIVAIVLTYSSNVIFQFLHEQQDKKFLRSTFGAYISPKLIEQMYEEKQAPQLGGVEGYHTAYFSDIQNFSTFSEALEPEKMVRLMNEYLTEMTDVLLSSQGTLDKYIGDAIVAFYGAPMAVDEHEKKACIAALEMQERLKKLRAKWEAEGDWPDIVYYMRHRIGLNSGKMVTGNMGSEMRMNYTMMGDTVNLAARLESSAKHYGIYNFVGENTFEATKDDFIYRFIDYVMVKGKHIPVKVYELISTIENGDDTIKKLIKKFDQGIEHYHNQQWELAIESFKESEELEDHFVSRNTTPSAVFIERCIHFKDNPPAKDWDGVWAMTTK